MPADLNRVTLVGRLTRDPELRHSGGGDAICSMRLAVSSRSRDETGNWGDRSNYFDVTVFGRQAETASTYLAKGRRIGVDGRLSWREWQAQDGTKRQTRRGDRQRHLLPRQPGRGWRGWRWRRLAPQGGGWSNRAPAGGGDLPVDRSDMQPAKPPADDDDIPF